MPALVSQLLVWKCEVMVLGPKRLWTLSQAAYVTMCIEHYFLGRHTYVFNAGLFEAMSACVRRDAAPPRITLLL
jgi:hypothetical protein